MYIRIKRKKVTYFLHCEPNETIKDIKEKIKALTNQPTDKQRLIADKDVIHLI